MQLITSISLMQAELSVAIVTVTTVAYFTKLTVTLPTNGTISVWK